MSRRDYVLTFLTALAHKAPGLVAAMILTRVFAPEVMGSYFFSTALAFIALLITTFGTHIHLVRAVARDPERGLDALAEVLQLRLPLTALALLLLIGSAVLFAPALAPVLALTSIFVLVGDFASSFGAYITGRRHFGCRLLVALAGPTALLSTVPLAVAWDATLEQTLLCYVAASIVGVVVAAVVVRKRYGPFQIPFDLARLRGLVSVCWPFVVLEALQVVQFKIDTMMVFWILSAEAAAHYETAYRVLEVSRLAVRPLAIVAYPVCALMIAQQRWTDARAYGARVSLMAAAIGCGVMSIGLVYPEWIMVTVWGPSYAGTGTLLQILLLSTPFVFVGLVGVMVANAMGQERRLMVLMGCATLFNVSANAIAIPLLGTVGAAWTTLATEILILLTVAMTVRHATRIARAPAQAQEAGSAASDLR